MKKKLLMVMLVVIALVFSACSSENIVSENNETNYAEENVSDVSDENIEASDTVEDAEEMMGKLTLEECKAYDLGLFILYPDGSFDMYKSGFPMYWEGPQVMTYGADYRPEDLIISVNVDEANISNLKNGQLVYMCNLKNDPDPKFDIGFFPVLNVGHTLSGGEQADVIFLNYNYESGLQNVVDTWGTRSSGYRINNNSGVYMHSINGVSPDEFYAEPNGFSGYVDVVEGETYIIEFAEGTNVKENICIADKRYYNHEEETDASFSTDLTSDGYAIYDFSETPPGEYILTYSYWDYADAERIAYTYHIVVE